MRTVFLSGTRRDLGAFHVAAQQAIETELHGYRAVMMEDAPAEDISIDRWSRREAATHHLFVGLVGRYAGTAREGTPPLTEQEYVRAGTAGVHRLMFLTDYGEPSVVEAQDDAARHQLESFRARLEQVVRAYVSTPEEFARQVVRAIQEWERRTLGGVLISKERFAQLHAPPGPAGLLSHQHRYIGSQAHFDRLEDFARSEQRVLVLHGPWGRGKTRLLLEWCQRTGAEVRFLREDVTLSHELLTTAVDDPYILVAEDVHKREDDERQALLHFLRSRTPGVKLLVTTRTQRLRSFDDALRAQRFDPTQVGRIVVAALSEKEQRELIASILGEDGKLAYILARRTHGNALAGVVAARSALRGGGNIREVENEDFEKSVVESFADAVLESVQKEPTRRERYRQVLKLVAVAGPVRPADSQKMEALAHFLHMPPEELHEDLDALEHAGLLTRYGGLVRIPVDAIAEDQVVRAAVNRHGESTGYIERALESLAESFARNILRNLATADWDPEQSGRVTTVTQHVWRLLPDLYERMPNYLQDTVRKAIAEIAPLHPEHALRFVERFLGQEPSLPEGVLDDGRRWARLDAQQHFTKILVGVLDAPACVARACDLLWKLAEPENPQSLHPLYSAEKALQEANKYKNPQKPLPSNEAFLDWAETRSHGPRKIPGHRLARYLAPLLHKEALYSWCDGHQVTTSAVGLLYAPNAALRQRTIDLLLLLAKEGDYKDAKQALSSLGGALTPPLGALGRRVDQEERKQWLPEQQYVLAGLRRLWQQRREPILALCISKQLEGVAKHSAEPSLRDEARALVDEMRAALEGSLEQALHRPWYDDVKNYQEASLRFHQVLAAAVQSLLASTGSPEEALAQLTRVAAELRQAELLTWGQAFFLESAKACPEVASAWVESLLRQPENLLRSEMNGLVRGMLISSRESVLALVERIFHDGSPDILRALDLLNTDTELLGQDRLDGYLRRMLEHPEPPVRQHAFELLSEASGFPALMRSRLLFEYRTHHDPQVAKEWAARIAQDEIQGLYTLEERNLLAAALTAPLSLDYWCEQLITKLVEDVPGAVVDMMLTRIDASAQRQAPFEALPYVHERDPSPFSALPSAERQRAMLALSERFEHEDGNVRFLAREWFTKLAQEDAEAARALRRHWIEAGTPQALRLAIGSFDRAEPDSLFDCEEDIIHLLNAAERCGPDVSQNAWRTLVSVARHGARQGPSDAPFPLDVSILERARKLSLKYPAGTLAQRFYQQVTNEAQWMIERRQKQLAEEQA